MIDKTKLAERIRQLGGLTAEEKSSLLALLHEQKRYGLIWEEKPEEVEIQLQDKLPILLEVTDKRLPVVNGAPNHILIEGDNLHALTCLSYTHEGKIDVIYIDPPYNTGATTWRYNNDYIDGNDDFRHSKWISFINHRIKIARHLLKADGIIIVTIDDYEYASLKLLMDSVFGEDNYIGTIVIRNNPSGRSTVRGLSVNHEYALLYSKTSAATLGRLSHSDVQKSRYSERDENGYFEWENFRKNGTDSDRKDRPKQFYPIIYNGQTSSLRIPEVEWDEKAKSYTILESIGQDEIVLYPKQSNAIEKVWKFGIERARTIIDELKIKQTKEGIELYRKKYLNDEGSLPHTWWDKPSYSARDNGTRTLTNIFGPTKVFDFPKAPEAVKDALIAANLKKDGIVLDFFAGSGTTLHAVMQLNNEDGGRRQCILATNNENGICENVTYERNKRVIEGYTNAKGEIIERLPNNNLRYYRTEYVPRERTQRNMRALVNAATDMLCIQNNSYTEQTFTIDGKKVRKDIARWFGDILIIYHEEFAEEIAAEIARIDLGNKKLKVYIFSPGRYAFDDVFEGVQNKVELVALPAAIYDAYKRVLPKRKEKSFKEENKQEIPTTLF